MPDHRLDGRLPDWAIIAREVALLVLVAALVFMIVAIGVSALPGS